MGTLAGGFLNDVIGYRNTMLLFGFSTVTGLLVAAWDGWFKDGSTSGDVAESGSSQFRMWEAVRNPIWIGITASAFLLHLTTSGIVQATLGYYLRQRYPSGWMVGAVLIGVATLSGVFSSLRWMATILLYPVMGHASGVDLGAATGPLLGYYLIEYGIELPHIYILGGILFLMVSVLFGFFVRSARVTSRVL